MKRFLALFLALCGFPTITAAQSLGDVSAAPRPFYLFDAQNTLVGQVPSPDDAFVVFRYQTAFFQLRFRPDGPITGSPPVRMQFVDSSCSTAPLFPSQAGESFALLASTVGTTLLLETPNGAVQTVTVRSQRDPNGACLPTSPPIDRPVVPAISIENFTTRFVPPFRVQAGPLAVDGSNRVYPGVLTPPIAPATSPRPGLSIAR